MLESLLALILPEGQVLDPTGDAFEVGEAVPPTFPAVHALSVTLNLVDKESTVVLSIVEGGEPLVILWRV